MKNPKNSDAMVDEFGKIRQIFWPIHSYELKKFLPMAMIMFFTLFVYTCVRDTKDALVIPAAGAEVIPYLKGVAVSIASVLFMIAYVKLCNVFSKESIFYVIVIPFVAFFGAFAFVLYPLKDVLHPDPATVQALQEAYPRFAPVLGLWGIWTYALFFVVAEIWGGAMVSLMFWQFANEITRTKEAKRFYAMFGFIANFATFLSGVTVVYFSEIKKSLPADVDAWGMTLKWLMSFMVVCGFMMMLIYRWMHTSVLTDPKYYDVADVGGGKKKKPKMGLGESFKFIFSQPYLLFIALLIITYSVTINLVEVQWKGQARIVYPDNNDYNAFMGRFSTYGGLFNMAIMLVGANVLRIMSWRKAASITPAIITISGCLFFAFIIFRDNLGGLIATLGTSPAMMAVILGQILITVSKGIKYSLFDPTKEMAYIPLDDELKTKGKAVVDVVGGRVGKGAGGWIQMGLQLGTGASLVGIAPYASAIFVTLCGIWFVAVGNLNKKFVALNKAKYGESA